MWDLFRLDEDVEQLHKAASELTVGDKGDLRDTYTIFQNIKELAERRLAQLDELMKVEIE